MVRASAASLTSPSHSLGTVVALEESFFFFDGSLNFKMHDDPGRVGFQPEKWEQETWRKSRD